MLLRKGSSSKLLSVRESSEVNSLDACDNGVRLGWTWGVRIVTATVMSGRPLMAPSCIVAENTLISLPVVPLPAD